MNRVKALVAAVQTGATLGVAWRIGGRDARDRKMPTEHSRLVATAVEAVAEAAEVPEEAVPRDVADAALQLLAWKFDDAPRPEWLP